MRERIDIEQHRDFLALRLVQRGEQIGDGDRGFTQIRRDGVGTRELAAAPVGEAARDHQHEQCIGLVDQLRQAAKVRLDA